MKMTRYSEPQILSILRQAEGGVPASAQCAGPSVEPQTRLSHWLTGDCIAICREGIPPHFDRHL